MKYLLDTHIFLWWILDSPKLSKSAHAIIANPDHRIYVSAASTWEMVIKASIGKLNLPEHPEKFVLEHLKMNSMQALPVLIEHTFALADLPMIHKDPFDRILIAQAKYEGLTLVTDDRMFKGYDIEIV